MSTTHIIDKIQLEMLESEELERCYYCKEEDIFFLIFIEKKNGKFGACKIYLKRRGALVLGEKVPPMTWIADKLINSRLISYKEYQDLMHEAI